MNEPEKYLWESHSFTNDPRHPARVTKTARNWLATFRPEYRISEIAAQFPTLIFQRSCGPCTVCCTALGVKELSKPDYKQCQHLTPTGCGIYPERPESCKDWCCNWKMGFFSEQARPDLSGITVTYRHEDVARPYLIIYLDEEKCSFARVRYLASVLSHIMSPDPPQRGPVEICALNRAPTVIGTRALFSEFIGEAP